MYCPNCGRENADTAKFCQGCGRVLSDIGSQQEKPVWHAETGYQVQGYPQSASGDARNIPSYLGWAIAVLILCFWPTGIVAIVNATRVNNRLALGDFAGAAEASRKAKMWCWISFAIAIVWVVIVIIAVAVAGTTIY